MKAVLAIAILTIVCTGGCVPAGQAPAEANVVAAAAGPADVTEEPISAVPVVLPTVTPKPRANLPDLGPAPEIASSVWLNSEPLSLVDLRGSVVLVEFWTYG